MRLRFSIHCLAAAAGLLIASGCATSPKSPLPPVKSTVSITLTPRGRSILSAVELNDALVVSLPPPADGPGYSWAIVANNTKILRQTSPLKANPTGAATVTFQALRAARSILRFAAIKPGQAESDPTDLYQITVGVKSE